MNDKSKRTFNRWTSSEEELLKKLYEKNITLNDIADFFPNRTNKQVRAKYDYMFKTKKKHVKPSKRWSEEEEQILKDNYDIEWSELMKLLPRRSRTSIKKKLFQLDLHRPTRKITEEVEERIIELAKTHATSDIVKLTNLSNKSVYDVLNKHNVKAINRNQWIATDVDIEDEIDLSVTFTLNKNGVRGGIIDEN